VATTVHLPGSLLRRLDERAKALGISRNRLIVEAVEAKLVTRHAWPPELKAMLSQPVEVAVGEAFENSLAIVRKRRVNRKLPPQL